MLVYAAMGEDPPWERRAPARPDLHMNWRCRYDFAAQTRKAGLVPGAPRAPSSIIAVRD